MPGVPKSRGCDACRKRKKKCDASSEGCSWCRKLNIPCIGFGQQRYLFRDEGKKLKQQYRTPKSDSFHDNTLVLRPRSPVIETIEIFRTPSNGLTILTGAFVGKVSPTIDISHQLVGNFGGFLREVPKRLGVNQALDAAADTLVTAHTKYCAGSLRPDADTLNKHARALQALREVLGDPVKARASETLCAVMILSICQVFLSTVDQPCCGVSHVTGAAQILKGRGFTGPQDDFERLLLATLRGPVVIEAFYEDKVSFSCDEWQKLVMSDLDNGTPDGDLMVCLGQLPNLMQRARDVFMSSEVYDIDYQQLLLDVYRLEKSFRPVLTQLRERWSTTQMYPKVAANLTLELKRLIHCHHARMLAFGLAVGILINCVRDSLEYDTTALRQESTEMAREMLDISDIVAAYRPLGNLAMTIFLGAAYVGTEDLDIKVEIEARVLEFRQDFFGPDAILVAQDPGWCFQRFALFDKSTPSSLGQENLFEDTFGDPFNAIEVM